jgi:hypothetical protein
MPTRKGDQRKGDNQTQDQVGAEPPDGPLSRLAFLDGIRGFDRKRVKRRRLLTSSRLARRAQRVEVERVRIDLIERRKKQRDGEPPQPPGAAGAVNWTPVGPSVVTFGQATGNPPVSGRITSLAVGPSGIRAYAGAANGGVWVTEDGGATWEPLDDYFTAMNVPANVQADSLAIGALAVVFGAARADDVVYAGTGESNQGADSYMGVGIRRFGPPAGGGAAAWTLEATNLAGTWVSRLVVDPDDPTIVYAATGSGLFRRPTAGFATWTALTPTPAPGDSRVTDLAVASTGTDRRIYAAYINGAVYALDPATTTWTSLTGIPATPSWVCLSATWVPGASASQRVVYALTGAGALFRLAPGGATAFTAVTGMPPVTAGGQGWYDLAVEIEPGSADTVWLVGDWTKASGEYNLSLWRGAVSTAGATPNFGFTSTATPSSDATYRGLGVHSDGHAIDFPSDGSATPVWVGCDGGVFVSTTGAAGTFQPRNVGLAITELGYLADWATTDAASLAGCQDNGTVRFRGEPAWFESPRGDGGGVTIDPNNQYRAMRQYVRVGSYTGAALLWSPAIRSTTDGGQTAGSWTGVTIPPAGGSAASAAQKTAVNIESSRTQFYGPLASVFASDLAQSLAVFGTNRVWLSTDWGATWNTLPTNTNPYGAGGTNLTQDVLDDPSPGTTHPDGFRQNAVSALTFANANRLYASTAAGIWRFDRTGSTWTLTAVSTAGLPAGRRITDIEPVDAAAGSLYATLAGTPSTHVYFFSGVAGASWVNAGLSAGGANLDTPAHAVAVDPNNTAILYVATDVGVFRGQKTGATTWAWTPFSQGLPQASVLDLRIHQRTRLLRAVTHGRGLWEIELDSTSLPEPELYMRANAADTGRLLDAGHRYSWIEGHPDPSHSGSNVWHWMSPDIKIRRSSLSGLPTIGSPPTFYDFANNVGDYVDTTNVETVDPGANTAYVQVHNRSLTSINGSDIRVLLLLTDASAGLPNLPSGYAANIVSGAAPSGWVSGGWFVGDTTSPYKSPTGKVDARLPGVVAFSIDVATLSLPATHDHVCAAAFATTISMADRLTSTQASMDALTMADRHAVHRNLHVVAAGSMPVAEGGGPAPQTFIFDIHNASRKDATYDVLLNASIRPFDLSVVVNRSGILDNEGVRIVETSLEAVQLDGLDIDSRHHWEAWRRVLEERLDSNRERVGRWADLKRDSHRWAMYKLAKLSGLDFGRFLTTNGRPATSLSVSIPRGRFMTLVATWRPPVDAKPGWSAELEVIQRLGKRIVGGSTYALRVVEPSID